MKTSTGIIDYHLKGCMEGDFQKSGLQEEINFILDTIYQMRWEFEGERKS
jgi:hypothetical protein